MALEELEYGVQVEWTFMVLLWCGCCHFVVDRLFSFY